MNKLYCDDIRHPPDETWHNVRSVQAAIRAIDFFDYDIISLDHDISHQVTIGTGLERPYPCEETFEPVARYIALKHLNRIHARKCGSGEEDWNPQIILHTSNPIGAKNMKQILIKGLIHPDAITIKQCPPANRLELEI